MMEQPKKVRLAYFVSHPIQYQAPLLRRLAQEEDIDLTVFFWSDHSLRGYVDSGFGGVTVQWDVPLLDGYKSTLLPAIRRSSEITFASQVNYGMFQALREGNFDAVWLHGYWSINSLLTMASAKLLGIPLLLRSESTLIDHGRSPLKLSIKKLFFAVLKHFVTAALPVGTLNRQYWEHYLGKQFPCFMTPYAVDNDYFQRRTLEATASREQLRQEYGLEKGRPIVLYASKLMARKRCIDLVDAYLGMRTMQDGRLPYLLIVGDGEERAALESKVQAADVSNVRFLGFKNQSELGRFFDLCDLFVLPSVLEPFGLIVNEVMNAGKPVIVSDEVGCYPDLVKDGENGKVFQARDTLALRAALESLLADPETCRRMGDRGREMISGWSFEQDIQGLRHALRFTSGLPAAQPVNAMEVMNA